jgi:Tfp pilus assembly PilM family ATPase
VPGLADALSEALAQPVSRPDPFCDTFSGVPSDQRTESHFPLWSVPLGLALREEAA